MMTTVTENTMLDRGAQKAIDEWRYAEKALSWSGWGSPVGLGIMAVCTGFLCVAAGATTLFLHWAGLF